MSISSVSYTHPNRISLGSSAGTGRFAPVLVNRIGNDGDADDGVSNRFGPGRSNPLVSAMLQAVQGLATRQATVPASSAPISTAADPAESTDATASAATATTASTTTAASTDTAAATTLKDAAVAFAHELFSALRGSGRGEGEHQGHRHGGGGVGGYGDLAQKLETLASRLEGTPAAAPAATPTPVSATPAARTEPVSQPAPPSTETAATSTTAAATDDSTGVATPAAAAGTASPTSIHISIDIQFGNGGSAAPAERLVNAFDHFMKALNPTSGSAGTSDSGATSANSSKAQLATFLRSIAQSLRAGTQSAPVDTPTTGGLLNLTA